MKDKRSKKAGNNVKLAGKLRFARRNNDFTLGVESQRLTVIPAFDIKQSDGVERAACRFGNLTPTGSSPAFALA